MTIERHQLPARVAPKTAARARWVLVVNLVCYLLVSVAVLAILTVVALLVEGHVGIWGAAALAVSFAIASVPGTLVSSLVLLGMASGSESAARRRGAIGGAVVSTISMAITVALLVALTEPTMEVIPIAAFLVAMAAITGLGAGALAVWLRRAYWLAPT